MSRMINSLKLWEIEGCYHCSIIGTALTLKEVRRILKKAGQAVDSSISDYELHSFMVQASHQQSEISKAVQKYLEKKFRFSIAKYYKAESEEELTELWEKALEEGTVPEAYWAILSHPLTTVRLRERVFGKVHILSHLNGASGNEDYRKLKVLESRYKKAEEARLFYRSELKDSRRKLKELDEKFRALNYLEGELKRVKGELEESRSGELSCESRCHLERLEEKLAAGREREERSKRRAHELALKVKRLSEENSRLKGRLLTMEEGEHRNEIETPEASLEQVGGKSILYVGGRNSLIPKCREIVEQQGGGFIFHDGGIEQSTSRLSRVLSKVDIVMCPLDCISHDACSFVKKCCKRHQKKLILLKRSGVSSFKRGLGRITSTESISLC